MQIIQPAFTADYWTDDVMKAVTSTESLASFFPVGNSALGETPDSDAVQKVDAWSTATVVEVLQSVACLDQTSFATTGDQAIALANRMALGRIIGTYEPTECVDAGTYCWMYNMTNLRALCP